MMGKKRSINFCPTILDSFLCNKIQASASAKACKNLGSSPHKCWVPFFVTDLSDRVCECFMSGGWHLWSSLLIPLILIINSGRSCSTSECIFIWKQWFILKFLQEWQYVLTEQRGRWQPRCHYVRQKTHTGEDRGEIKEKKTYVAWVCFIVSKHGCTMWLCFHSLNI